MKQQVVVIHGGNTFKNYEDFIENLKNKEVSLDRLKIFKDWKNFLPEELGEKYEVLAPRMPNGTNAQYEEWKIWFEKIIPLLNDSPIFIGHSLGGIFLAKYLSENIVPINIKAVILVAAPFDDENSDETLGEFNLSNSLSKFNEQCKCIYLIQSEDDPYVLFEQFEKYKKLLPEAKTIIFTDKGHFLQDSFPEIVELVKKIS